MISILFDILVQWRECGRNTGEVDLYIAGADGTRGRGRLRTTWHDGMINAVSEKE